MYKDIYYSDTFFQMFVVPSFTYDNFVKHKDMVIDVYNKFLSGKIDKYPHGFWGSTTGLINTRIILDYLISENKLTIQEVVTSNKQFLISHKIHYQFFSFTVKELIETMYPDSYYEEKVAPTKDENIRYPSIIIDTIIEEEDVAEEEKSITHQDVIKYFSNAIKSEDIKNDTQKQMYEFVVDMLEKQMQRDELRVDLIDFYLDTGKSIKSIIKKYDLE